MDLHFVVLLLSQKTVHQADIADPDPSDLDSSINTSVASISSQPSANQSVLTPQGTDTRRLANIITPTKIRKPTLLELAMTVENPPQGIIYITARRTTALVGENAN